jgi:TonB-dependent SusC/RagA subfamily outer membrane receptor
MTMRKKIMILPVALGIMSAAAFRTEAPHIGMAQWIWDTTPTPTIAPETRITFDQGKVGSTDSVLFIIDGKALPMGRKSFEQLNPNDVESLTILKGDSAKSLYGNAARNGVIIIKMKQAADTLSLTDDKVVFTKVEIEASFPGGQARWQEYLRTAMKEHWSELVNDNKSGTCTLTFIVHKDGHVSNVAVTGMEGSVFAQFGVNLIKNGPRWAPALQNGYKVNAYRQQEITVQMPN